MHFLHFMKSEFWKYFQVKQVVSQEPLPLNFHWTLALGATYNHYMWFDWTLLKYLVGKASQCCCLSLFFCQWWEHNHRCWEKPEFSQCPEDGNQRAWSRKELHSGKSFEWWLCFKFCVWPLPLASTVHRTFQFAFHVCSLPSLQCGPNSIFYPTTQII